MQADAVCVWQEEGGIGAGGDVLDVDGGPVVRAEDGEQVAGLGGGFEMALAGWIAAPWMLRWP